MSDENVKDELVEIIKESIDEQKKVKENNEKISQNILNEIEETQKYLKELSTGNHIDPEAIEQNPNLLNLNLHIIQSCLRVLGQIEIKIKTLGVESEDLSYLLTINLAAISEKNEYSKSNYNFLPRNVSNSLASLQAVESFLSTLRDDKARYNQLISSEIKGMLEDAKHELEDFKKLKNILKNLKTEDYYLKESQKYMKRHYIYLGLFIGTILSALTISAISVCVEPRFFLDKFDYWFIKISFVLVAITLISYFVRQSSHYQSLADQANQTRLEILAFPTFITGMEKSDEIEIRKALALKYFGRELDKTAHKDMSNLVSDQMKNTTEMVKAVTGVIKKPGKQGTQG